MDDTAPANQFDQKPNWFDEILATISGVNAGVHAYQDTHNDTLASATAGAPTGPTNTQVLIGIAVIATVIYFVLE